MYLDAAFSFDLRVWGVLPGAAVLLSLLGMVELLKSSWSRSLGSVDSREMPVPKVESVGEGDEEKVERPSLYAGNTLKGAEIGGGSKSRDDAVYY